MSWLDCFRDDEGVTGNSMLPLGRGSDVGVSRRVCLESFAARDEGVFKILPKELPLGEGGAWRGADGIDPDDLGDLGDKEARRCVKDDCFVLG